jgi:indole-3-glycerol phosphate synthase
MRKDFIVDEYQLVEARALGADACLLIVAALTPKRLRSLLDCTRQLRMEALVETHTADEVKTALDVGARVVGVNHRNLDTFQVDVSLTKRFRELVPNEYVLVAESGIKDAADARRMRAAGADAVLVGEALMRSPSPAKLIHEFAS